MNEQRAGLPKQTYTFSRPGAVYAVPVLLVIDGVAMFVRQAAAQFELWTGNVAPTALFERLVRETLDN